MIIYYDFYPLWNSIYVLFSNLKEIFNCNMRFWS